MLGCRDGGRKVRRVDDEKPIDNGAQASKLIKVELTTTSVWYFIS